MASKKWEETQIKIASIEKSQRALELTQSVIAYKEFKNLSIDEQKRLRAVWDAYYAAVRQTPFHELQKEQLAAARKRDWKRVTELGREVKKMREAGDCVILEKPKGFDPNMLERDGNVVCYLKNEKRIKELYHIKPDLTVDDIFS